MSAATLTATGDTTWALGGELDFKSVPAIWPEVEKLVERGGELTLSLADVSRANSAGLVMLVEARDRARGRHCALRLTDVPDELLALARLSGVSALLGGDD